MLDGAGPAGRPAARRPARAGRSSDNTLVMFASDNGPLPTFAGARAAGLRGSKLSLYEGGIRVPFIVRWPGRVPAGRVDERDGPVGGGSLPDALRGRPGRRCPEGVELDGEDMSAALAGDAGRERVRRRCSGNTAGTTSSSNIPARGAIAVRTWRCATGGGSCSSTPTAPGASCTTWTPTRRGATWPSNAPTSPGGSPRGPCHGSEGPAVMVRHRRASPRSRTAREVT